MITTLRDYVYIIVLLLALVVSVGINYGNVLLRTVESVRFEVRG